MSSLDGLRLAKLAQKWKDVQSKAEPVLINSGLQKHNEVGPTVYSNTLEQDALQLPAALKHYWWGSLCDVMHTRDTTTWLHVCKTDHLLKRFQMNNYMHNNVEKY